jgi:large subunit ribosomal protein L3
VLAPGTEVPATQLVAGQRVDVRGVTVGKGFQGGMKRHGFAGQSASHGTSLTHRSLGSTGGCQDPGKVWRGKKMAGQMGNVARTQQGLVVHAVDTLTNSVLVKGSVPGARGSYVTIRDAVKETKMWARLGVTPPFPVCTGEVEAPEDGIIFRPPSEFKPTGRFP